jgi:hypothetical protein
MLDQKNNLELELGPKAAARAAGSAGRLVQLLTT